MTKTAMLIALGLAACAPADSEEGEGPGEVERPLADAGGGQPPRPPPEADSPEPEEESEPEARPRFEGERPEGDPDWPVDSLGRVRLPHPRTHWTCDGSAEVCREWALELGLPEESPLVWGCSGSCAGRYPPEGWPPPSGGGSPGEGGEEPGEGGP